MRTSAAGSRLLRTPAKAGVQSRALIDWAPAFAGAPSRAKNAREGGFTLIELMIVITIIGLMTAVVVMTMPDPRGRLIDEAERFAARTFAARDLAIVDGRPIAVRVTPAGYAFDRRSGGAWAPMNAKPFRSAAWTEGTSAIVGVSGTDRLAFDTTGLASEQMVVTLVRGGERMRIVVGIDGKVTVGA